MEGSFFFKITQHLKVSGRFIKVVRLAGYVRGSTLSAHGATQDASPTCWGSSRKWMNFASLQMS